MGIASPYRAGAQLGSYPLRAGRSRGVVQGAKGQQEPFAAAFVVLPYPSPRSRHYCLSVALWDGFRCSAYGATRPAENLGPEGVKSAEAVPPAMVDVQPCAKAPGRA